MTGLHVISAAIIGAGATLLMDGWNQALLRAFGVRSLDYCLLGRWLRHMPATFRHASIASATPRSHECRVGWVAHYTIGVSLALAFVALAPAGWLARPTLTPALAYGLATVVFPFLVLQPSIGLGVASAKAPHPARARLKSLTTHAVFGTGLYLCASLLARIAA